MAINNHKKYSITGTAEKKSKIELKNSIVNEIMGQGMETH
jgi:hypothetical protein